MDKGILDSPKNVHFKDLLALCKQYFGDCRIRGSHHIFKMPWKGEPRINIQRDNDKAKPCQVRNVKKAIEKLEGGKYGEVT
ncbi:hypothetical protein ES703_43088 [subsurface metagenome]